MFGILSAPGGALSEQQKQANRLHYCGTCKAIGKLYGQKERLFLNYDAVFLSKLLSELSGENTALWHNSLKSYNCFRLTPTSQEDDLPMSLQYAATANLLFVELKSLDRLDDSKQKIKWKLFNSVFEKKFKAVHRHLHNTGTSVAHIMQWNIEQSRRENDYNKSLPAFALLDYFAQPTMQITAAVFAGGANAVGKPEVAPALAALGRHLGKAVYLLDALEDYDEDLKTDSFNALAAALGTQATAAMRRQSAETLIEQSITQVLQEIKNLNLSSESTKLFSQQLVYNFDKRLGKHTGCACSGKGSCATKTQMTFEQKWQQAGLFALRASHRLQLMGLKAWKVKPLYPLLFLAAVLLPYSDMVAQVINGNALDPQASQCPCCHNGGGNGCPCCHGCQCRCTQPDCCCHPGSGERRSCNICCNQCHDCCTCCNKCGKRDESLDGCNCCCDDCSTCCESNNSSNPEITTRYIEEQKELQKYLTDSLHVDPMAPPPPPEDSAGNEAYRQYSESLQILKELEDMENTESKPNSNSWCCTITCTAICGSLIFGLFKGISCCVSSVNKQQANKQ